METWCIGQREEAPNKRPAQIEMKMIEGINLFLDGVINGLCSLMKMEMKKMIAQRRMIEFSSVS